MLGGDVSFFIMFSVVVLIIFFGVKHRNEILKKRPDETEEEYNIRVQEERKKWKMQDDEYWDDYFRDRNNTVSHPFNCHLPQNFFYVEPFHHDKK